MPLLIHHLLESSIIMFSRHKFYICFHLLIRFELAYNSILNQLTLHNPNVERCITFIVPILNQFQPVEHMVGYLFKIRLNTASPPCILKLEKKTTAVNNPYEISSLLVFQKLPAITVQPAAS